MHNAKKTERRIVKLREKEANCESKNENFEKIFSVYVDIYVVC